MIYLKALGKQHKSLSSPNLSDVLSDKNDTCLGQVMLALWVVRGAGRTEAHQMNICKNRGHLLAYHWRELPQVWFLSRQSFCRNKRVNMSFVMTKVCLPQQLLSGQNIFVMTKLLWHDRYFSWQTCVMTSILLLRQRTWFVSTNIWTHVCRDKNHTYGSSCQLGKQVFAKMLAGMRNLCDANHCVYACVF